MTDAGHKTSRRKIAALAALSLLVAAWVVAMRAFTLDDVGRFAALAEQLAVEMPVAVFAALTLAQAAGMALSLPTKALLVLLAGALLGPALGALATEIGVLAGTTALFFGFRRLAGRSSLSRFGALATRFERRLLTRPVAAIAGLRLLVTIPYGPITIACAATGVRYRDFAVGSLVGDLPVTCMYAYAGNRLSAVVSRGEALTLPAIVALTAAGILLLATTFAVPLSSKRKQDDR